MVSMYLLKPLIYFCFSVLMLSTSVGLAFAKNDKYKMKYSKMDINHDGIVTREEWVGNESLFYLSDWNGDGVLSGDEAPGGARRGDDYDRNHSKGRFRDLDQNKNNVVTPSEWDGLVKAFNRLDDNQDGVLHRSEFIDHRIEGIDPFTELDRDGDGKISRPEWQGNSLTFNHLDNNHDGQLQRTEFSNPPNSGK